MIITNKYYKHITEDVFVKIKESRKSGYNPRGTRKQEITVYSKNDYNFDGNMFLFESIQEHDFDNLTGVLPCTTK